MLDRSHRFAVLRWVGVRWAIHAHNFPSLLDAAIERNRLLYGGTPRENTTILQYRQDNSGKSLVIAAAAALPPPTHIQPNEEPAILGQGPGA